MTRNDQNQDHHPHQDSHQDQNFDAWSPGLDSTIPPRLHHLITLFHHDHAWVSYQDATEAMQLTGLLQTRLVDLKFERMAVQELLVRVTVELSVPDGPSYEYLGLQLRGMVAVIHKKYIAPELENLSKQYDDFRQKARAGLMDKIRGPMPHPQKNNGGNSLKKSWLRVLGLGRTAAPQVQPQHEDADLTKVNDWGAQAKNSDDPDDRAQFAALEEIGRGMLGQRGRLSADHDMIATLALRLYCQDHGSLHIRQMIAPIFDQAVAAEGYRRLPNQSKRIVMNTKGASAAGKSTIRPHQRKLANRLGIPWKDFALISPDYWRKYLLDYDGLGDDYKYAAMLTGMELAMIDQKLDRFVAEKAMRNDMPHMLIDRFRFDSFMVSDDGEYESKLLTRFGDTVYLFFVITPPAATVERAWQRGLSTQRYKAVDDLLYHNIEAYKGMPELFFSWAAVRNKIVHYEFLDNDVPLGDDPKTIAFGNNRDMTILDPKVLMDIDRFRHVNIHAKRPEDVLKKPEDLAHENRQEMFLPQCMAMMKSITWANQDDAKIWGIMAKGQWQAFDQASLPEAVKTNERLKEVLAWPHQAACPKPEAELDVTAEQRETIGAWAKAAKI